MSAASGPTLSPINLSLLRKPVVHPEVSSRYIIPTKRTGNPLNVAQLEVNDANFPSFGVPDIEAPVERKTGFKQTILNLIAKDTMDEVEREVERNKKPQVDIMKMSNTELLMNGWTILPLTAKDSAGRFNSGRVEVIVDDS